MSDLYDDLNRDIGNDVSADLKREAESTSMILVLGETGAGKSYFINSIAPGSCDVSPELSSCTAKPSAVEVTFDGKTLVLVDTPGFNDTRSSYDRSDAVILAEIAEMIAVQSTLGVQMKGILYLHDIHAARMTGEALRQLTLLQKICGEHNWDHVSFVTTKWPDEAAQIKFQLGVRESDLRRKFWRPMLRKGSRMYHFEDTKESAESIVRSLISQPAVKFLLQEEMTASGSLGDTTAGKYVVSSRVEDEKRRIDAQVKPPQSSTESVSQTQQIEDMAVLQKSIENRKKSEAILNENVALKTKVRVKTQIEGEYKKTGKRPTIMAIISILIELGSFAAGLVQAITS